MGATAKQEVELFFGELKQGALLERCRTDTHKIVLTLIGGQPRSVRLEPVTRPEGFPGPQTLNSGNSRMEAVAMSDEQLAAVDRGCLEEVAMSDEQLAAVARGCLEEADPYLRELKRRGYNVLAEVQTNVVQTPDGKFTTIMGPIELRITREIAI